MGAYLSEPVIEKVSSEEEGPGISYGASSMQGWRVSQEDAHNSILNFDDDTHVFAVYDGHGGHEVSAYTALKLPSHLRSTEAYSSGDLPLALTTTFLGLDATLVRPEVVAELKVIAGTKDRSQHDEGDEDSESEGEDVQDLYREATMPLDQVMARYPHIAHHVKEKVASPFLKAKGNGGSGSSSSEDDSPTKFDFKEENGDDGSSSCATEEEAAEVNGEGHKHMVNGGEEEEEEEEEEKKAVLGKKKEKNGEMKMEEEEEPSKKDMELKTNGDTVAVNGEQEKQQQPQETGKGKGKGCGKGSSKGKALLKNSEIQAMKEAKAKDKRRKAAIRAAEIYREIQGGVGGEGGLEDVGSDDDDDDEDDDNFEEDEEEGRGEVDGEESDDDEEDEEEDEEEEEEEEEEDEEEDDDDPYTKFAFSMKEEPGYDSGCTACVAVVQHGRVTVANVGDSRAVVSRGGQALDLSVDHKPEDDPETARIIRAGGRVTADGRVNGGLNLSRAIGDHGYKQNTSLGAEDQMISPLPDVRSLALTPTDTFMIVACDGIWNSLSSQEACDFVSARLEEDKSLSKICEELFDHCLAPDTHGDGTGCDNMTCIIVKFDPVVLKGKAGDPEEGVVVEEVPITAAVAAAAAAAGEEGKEEEVEEEEGEERGSKTSCEKSSGVKRNVEEAELDTSNLEDKKLKPNE